MTTTISDHIFDINSLLLVWNKNNYKSFSIIMGQLLTFSCSLLNPAGSFTCVQIMSNVLVIPVNEPCKT